MLPPSSPTGPGATADAAADPPAPAMLPAPPAVSRALGGHRHTMSLDRRPRPLVPPSYALHPPGATNPSLAFPPPPRLDTHPPHNPSPAADGRELSPIHDRPLAPLLDTRLPAGLDRSAPAFSPAAVPADQAEFPGFAQAVAALQTQSVDLDLDLPSSLFHPADAGQLTMPPATTPTLPTRSVGAAGKSPVAQAGVLMDSLVVLATSARARFRQGEHAQSKLFLDCLKRTVQQAELCYAHVNSGHGRSLSLRDPVSPSALAPSSAASSAMPTPAEQPQSIFPFGSPGLGKRRGGAEMEDRALPSSKHFCPSNIHQEGCASQPRLQEVAPHQSTPQAAPTGLAPPFNPSLRSVETTASHAVQNPLDACMTGQSNIDSFPNPSVADATFQGESLFQSLLSMNPTPEAAHAGHAAESAAPSPQDAVPFAFKSERPPTRCPNRSLPVSAMQHFRGEQDMVSMAIHRATRSGKAPLYANALPTAHMRAASDSYILSPLNTRPALSNTAQPSGEIALEETQSNAGIWAADFHPEVRDWLDQVLLEFLNELCSDLQFKDRTGQEVHQLLMPKRMARLNERPGFRPFRFRINAFTQAFHARVVERHGKPGAEYEWSLKQVKKYLWSQPLISRFNEDGRKAKSRGNHNWIIDARKRPQGGWEFREFTRRIAGAPLRACLNVPWVWRLRIWDPLGRSIRAKYDVQEAPHWVRWMDDNVRDTLVGTPTFTSDGATLTVVATFRSNGQTEELRQSFFLEVVHADMMDTMTNGSLVAEHESRGRVRYPGDTTPADSAATKLGTGSMQRSNLPAGYRAVPTLSAFQFPRGTTVAEAGTGQAAGAAESPVDAQAHLPLCMAIEMRQQDHANKLLLSLPVPRSAGPDSSSSLTSQMDETAPNPVPLEGEVAPAALEVHPTAHLVQGHDPLLAPSAHLSDM